MINRFAIVAATAILSCLLCFPADARNSRDYTNKAREYFNGDDAAAAVKKMRANPRGNARQNLDRNRHNRSKNKNSLNENRTVETRQKMKRTPAHRRGLSNNSSNGVND